MAKMAAIGSISALQWFYELIQGRAGCHFLHWNPVSCRDLNRIMTPRDGRFYQPSKFHAFPIQWSAYSSWSSVHTCTCVFCNENPNAGFVTASSDRPLVAAIVDFNMALNMASILESFSRIFQVQ
jgi:hypothetical protein